MYLVYLIGLLIQVASLAIVPSTSRRCGSATLSPHSIQPIQCKSKQDRANIHNPPDSPAWLTSTLSLSLSLGPSNGCHGPSILLVTIVRKSFGGSPELIEVQGRKILLPRAKGDLQARKSWYPAAWIPSCPRLSWYLLLGAFPPRARARARGRSTGLPGSDWIRVAQ